MHMDLQAPGEKIVGEEASLHAIEPSITKGAKIIYLNAANYAQKINEPTINEGQVKPLKRKYNPLLFLWNWAHNFMSTVAHMLH